jgi:hypothetical protein
VVRRQNLSFEFVAGKLLKYVETELVQGIAGNYK